MLIFGCLFQDCVFMSDCSSPVFRRRPRVAQQTPASASSNHSGRQAVMKKKKKNKNVKKRLRRNRCNRRQQSLSCPLLDHQAKEQGNSEDDVNSVDDRDATDDSIVASGSDHSNGSFSIYAIGMSSQAEKHGFTVPLNQVRDRERDRASIADVVLSRISKNKYKNLEFEAYLKRIGHGGVDGNQEQFTLPQSAVSFEEQELSNPLTPDVHLQEQVEQPACPADFKNGSTAEPPSSLKHKQALQFLPDLKTHSSYFPALDLTFSEAVRAPAVRPPGRLMLRRPSAGIVAVAVPKCDNSSQTSPRWEHDVKTVEAAAGNDLRGFSDSSMQTSPQTHLSCCDSSGQTSPRLNEPLTLRELRNEVRELLKGMGF
jgi:hypothetical protein